MKVILFLFTFVAISTVSGYSPPVVPNTKITNARGVDVCMYRGIEIEKLQTTHRPGRCQELYCDGDFNVHITKCYENPSGRCQYEGANYELPYPDCCGIQLCS